VPRPWDLDDLADSAMLAERIGVAANTIPTWASRYPTFPPPLVVLSNRVHLYSTAAVLEWCRATNLPQHRGRDKDAP
jgi:hypothetical protein